MKVELINVGRNNVCKTITVKDEKGIFKELKNHLMSKDIELFESVELVDYEVSNIKIEIVLRKINHKNWIYFDKLNNIQIVNDHESALSKPYSYDHNEQMMKQYCDIDDEDIEAGIPQDFTRLCQGIGKDDPQAKQAMEKSFRESNGTTLNMNYDEVFNGKSDKKSRRKHRNEFDDDDDDVDEFGEKIEKQIDTNSEEYRRKRKEIEERWNSRLQDLKSKNKSKI